MPETTSELINAPNSAELLGVSRGLFNSLVRDGLVKAAGTRHWKYGEYSVYKRADLESSRDNLLAHLEHNGTLSRSRAALRAAVGRQILVPSRDGLRWTGRHVSSAARAAMSSELRAALEEQEAREAERQAGIAEQKRIREAARSDQRRIREEALAEQAARIKRDLVISFPPATPMAERVIAHLGPTNSGKTYAALGALRRAGSGAYGAPLRLLAHEAYDRLRSPDWLGEDAVGLRTGEERINDGASIIACTVELMPAHCEVAVVDEIHWLADPERGSAWVEALLSTRCRELHLMGSYDALPLLREAVPAERLEVREYQRLAPLSYIGRVNIKMLEPTTVVVAFSRKAVLAIAREAESHRKGRVGVLYGSMPLGARRDQVARFASGELEVMVSTDVLGHGLNLPTRTLLFAETNKFDGQTRRDLQPWEVSQIAGRAGRFGQHEEGLVGVLSGLPWATPDRGLVERSIHPSLEIEPGHLGFRKITTARFGPRYADLVVLPVADWPEALFHWQVRAAQETVAHEWLIPIETGPMAARLIATGPKTLHTFEPETAWRFAHAPLDADDETDHELLGALGAAVATGAKIEGVPKPKRVSDASLEVVERYARQAVAYRWFTRIWDGVGGLSAAVARDLEERANARVSALVPKTIERNHFGVCESCGGPAMPWFDRCDSCHNSRYDDWE